MENRDSFQQAFKSAGQILPLIIFIVLAFVYFASRYTLSFNVATSDCLNSRVFLIDKWDKRIAPDRLLAFTMHVENGLFETGRVWVKNVAAVGGQTVNVSLNSVEVGEREYELVASYILNRLGKPIGQLQTQWELADDELFMIGETLTSFDSRFWGPIKRQDAIGRAYAIF